MYLTEISGISHSIPSAVLGALMRVPPLSPASAKLYTLNEENADMRRVAALISGDPALSALVLRLVNSPLFGVRHSVKGILQAVALLGLDRIRSLATTAAMKMLVNPAFASPALTRCWRHSIATALGTKEVAMRTNFESDSAYTAGLLHDIGCFAMLSCWPKEYGQLLATCPAADLLQSEVEALGVSHADAGAFLLQHWGLPPELVEVSREHHGPLSERKEKLVELVSQGCRLADAIGFSLTAEAPEDDATEDALDYLGAEREGFFFRVSDGINQIECLLL